MFFRVIPWLILLPFLRWSSATVAHASGSDQIILLLIPCFSVSFRGKNVFSSSPLPCLCFCCFRVFPCSSVANSSSSLPWLIFHFFTNHHSRFQLSTNNSSTKSPCQPAPPPSFRLVYINTPKEPNHGYSRFLPLHSLRTITQTRFFSFMRPLQIHGGHSQVIPAQAQLDSPLGCPPPAPFSKSKTPKAPFHHLIHPQLRKPHL